MKLERIEIFFGAILAIIVAIPFYFLYQEAKSEKIVLIKAEWVCKDSGQITNFVLAPNGMGGTNMIPVTSFQCVNYVRKQK